MADKPQLPVLHAIIRSDGKYCGGRESRQESELYASSFHYAQDNYEYEVHEYRAVTLCRNCKHWVPNHRSGDNCQHELGLNYPNPNGSGFCHLGVPR